VNEVDFEADRAPTQADLGPLEPFLILSRADHSLVVAARARDGIIHLAPLIAVPDPPRRRLLECPCCDRWIVWSEWPDGRTTLTPLSKQNDNGDIPF
jgi:hypothetical protein